MRLTSRSRPPSLYRLKCLKNTLEALEAPSSGCVCILSESCLHLLQIRQFILSFEIVREISPTDGCGCAIALLVWLPHVPADRAARRRRPLAPESFCEVLDQEIAATPHGRPEVATEIRDLIRRMSQANPLLGVLRIHVEHRNLGIAVAQSTVAGICLVLGNRCRKRS